jgi:hypothetical protein
MVGKPVLAGLIRSFRGAVWVKVFLETVHLGNIKDFTFRGWMKEINSKWFSDIFRAFCNSHLRTSTVFFFKKPNAFPVLLPLNSFKNENYLLLNSKYLILQSPFAAK